jgi:hypothetical protein
MADMGHYSLWTVFNALELEGPVLVEPNFVHVCGINNNTEAYKIINDFSFPYASSVRFRYPATASRSEVDLFWYDGGMRPQTPADFLDQGIELPSEGMMFVGENGIIMSSQFLLREPYLLAEGIKPSEDVPPASGAVRLPGIRRFVDGVKSGNQIDGNFRQAWGITEAVNLYAVALRAGKILKYDADNLKVTNDEAANQYLDREYRNGWAPENI